MIHDKACCKPSVLCEPFLWCISLPGKHVWNIAYNQLQEILIPLPVKTGKHWDTCLKQTASFNWEKNSGGAFNSPSYAETGYGLSQQLPRRGWMPRSHTDCYTLPWEGGSGVWDTEAAHWYVPKMATCWVSVPWLCLFPYLFPQCGILPCGIFLWQHNVVHHISVLLNNK